MNQDYTYSEPIKKESNIIKQITESLVVSEKILKEKLRRESITDISSLKKSKKKEIDDFSLKMRELLEFDKEQTRTISIEEDKTELLIEMRDDPDSWDYLLVYENNTVGRISEESLEKFDFESLFKEYDVYIKEGWLFKKTKKILTNN